MSGETSGGALPGLMQDDFPLTLHHIRRRMKACSPDATVSTLLEPGVVAHKTFAETSERIDRLARVLDGLGVEPGQRVGTFAWNNQRHFELYFAIPCLGVEAHGVRKTGAAATLDAYAKATLFQGDSVLFKKRANFQRGLLGKADFRRSGYFGDHINSFTDLGQMLERTHNSDPTNNAQ